MFKTKKSNKYWIKSIVLVLSFALALVLIGKLVIYSNPNNLLSYLNFLNKNTGRAELVNIYSREEFSEKYLGLSEDEYKSGDVYNVTEGRFVNFTVKENRLFKVYQIKNVDDECEIYTFGFSKKYKWVYVTLKNICSNNSHESK